MAGARITYDDKDLRNRVRGYPEEFDRMMRFLIEYHAAAGTAKMKGSAPWTDRTGAARSGLFSVTDHGGGRYTIVMSHTMHYGFWLEVKFSARDAIIMPTVKSQGRALMDDIRKRLK